MHHAAQYITTGVSKIIAISIKTIKKHYKESRQRNDIIDESKEIEIIIEEAMKFEDNAKSKLNTLSKSLQENGKKKRKKQTNKACQYKTVKLPKFLIKNINGDPVNWQGFLHLFEDSIHHSKTLAKIEKFNHLIYFPKENIYILLHV